MKKFITIMIVLVMAITFVGCSQKTTLTLLNWGDYMNEDLLTSFEQEYNVKVKTVYSSSNEDMYTQIKAGNVNYDITIPSDYMIEKLYKEDLLVKLDYSKLTNFEEGMFDDKLETARANYFKEGKVEDYSIPYFWGTIGIMYNDRTEGTKEIIEENGWDVFFDNTLTSTDIKLGMYNNARDAAAVAQLYKGYSLNTTDDAELAEVGKLLKQQKVDFKNLIWGDDTLKTGVASKNYDFAMVYAGDFFDQISILTEAGQSTEGLGFYVPKTTNLFFDAMVIPSTSKNVDLAHSFINYFLDKDVTLENVDYVGYCPTITAAIEELRKPEYQEGYWLDLMNRYEFYPGNEAIDGEIYNDLGKDVYIKLEEILNQAKI